MRNGGFHNLARREVLEVEQHLNNINREDGLRISKTWRLALKTSSQSERHE